MPFIVTTVHDPVALTATCRQLNLPRPKQGSLHLDDLEASGWIVRVAGVRYPIVCNTLTGLIAYHPDDNVFSRYARLMRFVHSYYDIQAQLRQGNHHPAVHRTVGSVGHRRAVAV